MGIGKVRVQMKDGSSFVLENVRYIPELKRNLISLGTLDREGYTVKLQNGRVKVIKGSLMVLSGTMKGNCVYSLDGWAESGEASVGIQEKESLAQVWHKRLGHISEAGLHELEKREVLGNKGLGKLEFCENCVLGKSTRGPSRVESMSGCRYFLSIVDDYSRRVWVHFLRHKNEAFSKFKEWKQLVENQTGRKLKKLRTDNGLEFCNQEFNNLYKESEIARHLTVAGTPQQNGLAERMNKTLLNKVRCLLIQSGLSDSFWAEATVTLSLFDSYREAQALSYKCYSGYSDGVKDTDYGRLWKEMWNKMKGRNYQNLEELMFLVCVVDKEQLTILAMYMDDGLCIMVESIRDGWVHAMKEEMSFFKERFYLGAGRQPLVRSWVILSLTAFEDYELEKHDMKMAFLHGNLKETISMRQPPGFEEGTGNKVCLLKKSLYGLKQSPRQWYQELQVIVVLKFEGWFVAKFDVENFDGSNDFGMWRVKMRRLLIQHGWEAVLDPFPKTMADAEKTTALKTDVYKKAHSALLLYLDNKVLREVNKEDSAASVWIKLETLYMTKSSANKLYLKKKLFTFYMDSGKKLSEHIDVFNKLIGDLANIDVEIKVAKIGTKDNVADAFTKVVPGPKFKYCMKILGVGANQTQDQEDRVLDLRRREEKSLIYNTSFLGEYECSSLAIDRRKKKIEDEIGSFKTRLNYVNDQEI
ncbi:retrotransposon protein, putative, ty1-copia subclass [Tanacetum coccineum]